MITAKPIALDQVRWAIRACEEKRGMEFIATCFNACIERGEMDSAFHLPAGEYRRYAHLLADLVKIERQILNILQGRDALTGEPLLNEEDDRATHSVWVGHAAQGHFELLTTDDQRSKALNAAHVEALEVEARRNLIARQARFVFHNTAAERAQAIENAHAEALAENQRFDWLATRFAMFWGGCDNAARDEIVAIAWEQARHMIEAEVEDAHAEALIMNARCEVAQELAEQYDLSLSEALELMAETVEKAHAEALIMNANYGSADQMAEEFLIECDHAAALGMNEAFDTAVRVIKAMAGHDIEAVLSGVRAGLYRSSFEDVHEVANMALRLVVNEAHAEALAMDYQKHQEDFYRSTPMMKAVWVNLNHEEALAMNEQYDLGELMAADHERQIVFYELDSSTQRLLIELEHEAALWRNECLEA